MRLAATVAIVVLTMGCTTAGTHQLAEVQRRLDQRVPELLEQERAAGVGIAVVRDGEIEWTGYYGEQSEGVELTARTLFNTASIAKTITAETLLALAERGLVDMDEPIAPYVQHPDLANDPWYAQLTPRLLLSHRAGLLNWPHEYADNKLAFDHAPDTRFSYSGAGVELAARYAEAKTGRRLQELAYEYLLAPLGVEEMALGHVPDWASDRMAVPMDADGRFRSIGELNPGLSAGDADSAADDLVTTVPAYATLIAALTSQHGLGSAETQAQRTKLLTSLANDPVYRCPELPELRCPDRHGHSIGWQVWRYGDHAVVKHSGSDAGENAFVYYSPDKRHGAVIFVNGANGWLIMTRIIEMIGDEPLVAAYYRGLIQTVMKRDMPRLED